MGRWRELGLLCACVGEIYRGPAESNIAECANWRFRPPPPPPLFFLCPLGSADPIRMDDPISMGCGEGLSTCIFPRRDEVDEQSFVWSCHIPRKTFYSKNFETFFTLWRLNFNDKRAERFLFSGGEKCRTSSLFLENSLPLPKIYVRKSSQNVIMKNEFQLKDSVDHLIVKNAPPSLLFERALCSEHVAEFGSPALEDGIWAKELDKGRSQECRDGFLQEHC